MDTNINQALTDAVRRWALPTTPDDLKRRGVSSLHSVSMSKVAALIEKAVNRTLLSRTVDGGHEDAESFSTAARREFLNLLGSEQPLHDELSDVEQHAVSAIDQLKEELAERRQRVEQQQLALVQVDGAAGESDEDLIAELWKLFGKWGGNPERPSALEQEVIVVAVKGLRQERARAQRERLALRQREMMVLERRIGKLTYLLSESESARKRYEASGEIEIGVASEFDTVQGLSPEDALYEKKSALMSAIFDANLAMRGEVALTSSR